MIESILAAKAMEIIAPAAATLLTGLLSWALAEMARYVRSRTKDEKVINALTQISSVTETTVAEISQVIADGIRAKNGQIDKGVARDLQRQALMLITDRLSPEVMAAAGKGVTDLQAFITARIEQAVRAQKSR